MQTHRVYRHFPNPSFPVLIMKPTPALVRPFPSNLHNHNCIELLFVLEGELAVVYNGTEFRAKKDELCVFLPGQSHYARAVTDSSVYRSVFFLPAAICMADDHFFQQSFVEPLRMGTLTVPFHFSGEKLNPWIFSTLRQLNRDSGQASIFRFLMVLCLELLPYCAQADTGMDTTAIHPVVKSCLVYMRMNLEKRISLAELAAHVHLHPNYLSRLYKQETGNTIFTQLNRLRIVKARKLLEESRLSISQIAEQTGFSSADLFFRKYKAYYGVSPSEYRRQLKRK